MLLLWQAMVMVNQCAPCAPLTGECTSQDYSQFIIMWRVRLVPGVLSLLQWLQGYKAFIMAGFVPLPKQIN